ncbi:hypothetical protein PHYBOEH_004906 [Phytophthora boehmeriae]|uniref:Kazal-like domain-containing protein n=1 Tax=Phytophthora boehmeriae TaxID=109152 RepID=A0A8T1XA55_9STRA|nr:hypothetical protein PHYBOEH_004906 [Phytophthora boehmeriae]
MSKLVVTVATFASLLTQTLALESVDAVRLHMTLQSDSNTAGGSTACDGDCTREYLPVCGTNGETNPTASASEDADRSVN